MCNNKSRSFSDKLTTANNMLTIYALSTHSHPLTLCPCDMTLQCSRWLLMSLQNAGKQLAECICQKINLNTHCCYRIKSHTSSFCFITCIIKTKDTISLPSCLPSELYNLTFLWQTSSSCN